MNWKRLGKAIIATLITLAFFSLGVITTFLINCSKSETLLIIALVLGFVSLVAHYYSDLQKEESRKTSKSGMSEKPTAEILVARLVPEWGHRLELLHKVKEPYEHYSDSECEEVPTSAIESWQEVEI